MKLISFIINRFGYKPKNLLFFLQATTHKSFLTTPSSENSNERLEFLGDAVLDTVIAEYLFLKFPNEDEGFLTKIKSKIVNRKNLSEIANAMKIRDVLRFNDTRSINMGSLEGNAFEAIIGAIFLDGGFEKVSNSINNYIIRKYINLTKLLEEEIDFKSTLFIWCQRRKLKIDFITVSETIENGQRTHKVKALINNTEYGIGIGSSKKVAEQEAAQKTLELIGEL